MSGDDASPPAISAEHLAAIYAQSRETFPDECCGYIVGHGRDAQLFICANRQDRLHALDPESYPRTAANGYNIGGKELLDLARSFESERPATIIYHSHPRVGSYFSEEDTRAALAAGYPVDYLVVDAQDHAVPGSILFRREGDTYVELEVYGDPKRET
ncbi:MAG: Mov34/MPN/PAD-1 family protein [Nannocystaceae bacterium]|nr:Mov34/MPN/PAD-1 family protein [Nannocystaceae bacterium]